MPPIPAAWPAASPPRWTIGSAKKLLALLAFAAAGGLSLWLPLTLIPRISSNRILSYGLSQALALGLSFIFLLLFNNVMSKRSLEAIGLICDWARMRMALWGGLLGSGMISLSFILMLSFGAIKAMYISPPLNTLGILPLVMFIQGLQVMSEELVFRTYVLVELSEKMSELAACLLWAAAFGGIHIIGGNNNMIAILSITLAGIMLNMAYFLSNRNPWFTFGIHYGWNVIQMHMLFSKRFFDVTFSPVSWLGGDGNPEGSVVSMLVVFIAAGGMIFAHGKQQLGERLYSRRN